MAMSDLVRQRGGRPLGLFFLRDARYRREASRIAPYLDTRYYLENNADVAASGVDAGLHYVKYGWREGRDPSPSFSTNGYLSAHPGVALAGTNPLLHFIEGQGGAIDPEPDGDSVRREEEIALVAQHLDQRFYDAEGASRAGMSSAEHYCRFGWREGRDPTPGFSTSYYLMTNPDIRDSGVNPFWHYLIAGREEGRLPSHPGGWKHGVLSRQTSFEAYCADWTLPDPEPALMGAAALAKAIAAARRTEGLMLSVGHDDYRASPGGVQLCIEIEERDARANGVDYLNLHPWQPLPKLADAGADPILRLVLNGKTLGCARAATVIAALPKLTGDITPRMVIHHLAGHTPEVIAALAKALGVKRAHLWLHDYFTVCTSYALQRNNVTPCNVPRAGSNACGICLFGAERQRQQTRIATLFERLAIDVVSPSDVALEFWTARTELAPRSTVVHPHMQLTEGRTDHRRSPACDGPVRIAFIGTPAPHKGWPIFTELQRRMTGDDGVEFWYFGATDPGLDGLRHVPTHVRAAAPDSTLRVIAEHRIDLVLHWAGWRETFSFSTFEALGGGAFVLTNSGSGNVAAAVTALDRGMVLDSAEALYDLAASGGLKDLAQSARARRSARKLTASFSGMTHDLTQKALAS